MRRSSSIAAKLLLGVCLLFVTTSDAMGGALRITMNDGATMDVPYYWEESGEVKFQVAGGIAGFPKGQIASIQEIVTSGEFDPEVLLEAGGGDAGGNTKALQDLIVSKPGSASSGEVLSSEESLQALKRIQSVPSASGRSGEKVSAPSFRLEKEFAELVRSPNGETMLVMKGVLSSRSDLQRFGFVASFFNGEGNLVTRKTCEIQEIDVDRKTLRKMGMQGRIFAVSASIKPDSSIKRYEITVAH